MTTIAQIIRGLIASGRLGQLRLRTFPDEDAILACVSKTPEAGEVFQFWNQATGERYVLASDPIEPTEWRMFDETSVSKTWNPFALSDESILRSYADIRANNRLHGLGINNRLPELKYA